MKTTLTLLTCLVSIYPRVSSLNLTHSPATVYKVTHEVQPGEESEESTKISPWTVTYEDVEKYVQEELGRKPQFFDFVQYHEFGTMYRWMEVMVKKHGDVAAQINIGRSTESRPIKLIRIGIPNLNRKFRKPSIFIEGGIHGQEWAVPPVILYMMNELLTNRKENMDILTQVDIYLTPIVNPDGYEYSRTVERMWSKNRRKIKYSNCTGIDLNRNFEVGFGGEGSSGDACSDTFRGSRTFSEPETRAIRNFIKRQKTVDWRIYLGVHSHGQKILTPWGYKTEVPSDNNEVQKLGERAADAIKNVHGSLYKVGTASSIAGVKSGFSLDWAKGSGYFKYAYILKIRDNGEFGDLLPEAQILPTAQEMFQGFKVFANFLTSSDRKQR